MLFQVASDDADDFAEYEQLISYRMKGRSEIVALTGAHNKRIMDRKLNLQTATAAEIGASKGQSELLSMNQMNGNGNNGGDHVGPNGKGKALKKIKNKQHRAEQHICPIKAKNKHINRNRFVFMSDIHVEPWYAVDSNEVHSVSMRFYISLLTPLYIVYGASGGLNGLTNL